MSELKIHRIGSFVHLETGGEPQKAMVTAVTVRESDKLTYEVVWWSGTTRMCVWAEACEIDASESGMRPATIGFLPEGK